MKTQGEIEAAICEGVTRFEQDYMGRGPKDIRAHLLGDLLVVRLKGVLTAAEQHLVKSLPADKGRDLLKQVRTQLLETAPAGSRSTRRGGHGHQSRKFAPRYKHGHQRRGDRLHARRISFVPRHEEEVGPHGDQAISTHGARRGDWPTNQVDCCLPPSAASLAASNAEVIGSGTAELVCDFR